MFHFLFVEFMLSVICVQDLDISISSDTVCLITLVQFVQVTYIFKSFSTNITTDHQKFENIFNMFSIVWVQNTKSWSFSLYKRSVLSIQYKHFIYSNISFASLLIQFNTSVYLLIQLIVLNHLAHLQISIDINP